MGWIRDRSMNDEIARGLIYVADCIGEDIKLVCKSVRFSGKLVRLGYTFQPLPAFYTRIFPDVEGMYYVKTCKDQQGKFADIETLRDIGIPFAEDKGWSACDLIAHFRERGDLQGAFLRISWLDAQRFEIASF